MLKRHLLFFFLLFVTAAYSQVDSTINYQNSFPANTFNINTNLPSWVIGIPSLGVGYKISSRNEILLDGTFSYWNFQRQGKPHYWRSWSVSPQFRSYINSDRSTYLGVQLTMGRYNISSQQGKYMGGGFSVGKQYYAGPNLLIDLGLTLGYLRFTDRASYIYHDNVFYTNREKENSNYWGPTAISIKLSRRVN